MSYPGGKAQSGTYQTIINQIPPHREYIEPFLGGGAILKHKRPAQASIVIDSDEDIVRSYLAENGGDRRQGWLFQEGGIHRLGSVTVIHGDGIRYLDVRERWSGEEFVYCDPPYLRSTRRQPRRLYRCELEAAEFDEAAHIQLLDVLRRLPAKVMISGYDSSLYRAMLQDWRVIEYSAMTRGGLAREFLWMNYPEPQALHDYRYLGADFREREKLRRRSDRLKEKLRRMPRLERLALTSTIAEFIEEAR